MGGLLETLLGGAEVDDIPNGLEVVCLDIFVLEIKGVLPGVDTNERHVAQQWILVGRRDNVELTGLGIVSQPAPSRSLNGGNLCIKFVLELVQAAKVAVNGVLERALAQLAASVLFGCEVLPKERVVDVA